MVVEYFASLQRSAKQVHLSIKEHLKSKFKHTWNCISLQTTLTRISTLLICLYQHTLQKLHGLHYTGSSNMRIQPTPLHWQPLQWAKMTYCTNFVTVNRVASDFFFKIGTRTKCLFRRMLTQSTDTQILTKKKVWKWMHCINKIMIKKSLVNFAVYAEL